ncbi:MAG: 3-hydroxybutyryl-CoA dehydrogenase [Defluviitaleaceae bacterium]|nr:3-hydroxybutyryl-CoA dehydrogenase [Defluviitaleaceae bacterium]
MKIFIAGAGVMGAGIAQVFAEAGHTVCLYDIKKELADNGTAGLNKALSRLVEKGKIDEARKSAIICLISATDTLADAADADLVVEAVVENAVIKRELFAKLDGICQPHTIFATNTSSISITEIATAVTRPEKVVGMHFFNPAAIMKLVEVIRGFQTSDETFEVIFNLSKEIGKEPVEVKEAPGFVVNKILVPMINEAICVLEQGVASAEDIDKAMTLGANHPIGPLALADLIGNDVVLYIMDTLMQETGDGKYRASCLLRKMVRAGRLGRKSGHGFYSYVK